MNQFSFSIRRVFHRLGHLGRMMTRSYGLTPSRFDLMHAIECQRQAWLPHQDLCEILGVTHPTVSKMVKALMRRGFVEKRPDPEDGRKRQIKLTRLGRTVLCCAHKHIVRSGYMRHVTARAVSDDTDYTILPEAEAAKCVEQMMTLLEALKRNLGDTSRFLHDDAGGRPPAIEHPIFEPDRDEKGNWPGDDPGLYFWIGENLPLPKLATKAA
jgi:DNA-binding MarR family transcriptional regulator